VGEVISKAFDDAKALRQLAASCNVVTYEFENVPVAALREIASDVPIFPPPDALHLAQDRVREKELFESLDIPLPRWHAVDTESDLYAAVRNIGLPLMLKTRRFGYDGKGQYLLNSKSDVGSALSRFAGKALIAEEWIGFDSEVSAIGVRAAAGQTAIYPLTQNVHRGGILRSSIAPAGHDELAALAAAHLKRLMSQLDYVGVLALEFFVVGETLLANEFAPRVHNSGHWTIEGAVTSQFENHLRAVLGLPLGNTAARGHVGMVNLIGSMPGSADALIRAGMHVHDYGKSPRAGRKLGHVTFLDATADARNSRLQRLDAMLNF
jgi:5-(carboxyamino)imidazole ribonucleotide synthase